MNQKFHNTIATHYILHHSIITILVIITALFIIVQYNCIFSDEQRKCRMLPEEEELDLPCILGGTQDPPLPRPRALPNEGFHKFLDKDLRLNKIEADSRHSKELILPLQL